MTSFALLPQWVRAGRVLIVGSLVAAGGCLADKGEEADAVVAEQALDAGDSGQAEASLLVATLDGTTLSGLTPAQVAAAASVRLGARFSPPGCATAVTSGDTLTITFDGCTGPRGLRAVDGTLALTYAAAGSGVNVTARATELRIGAVTLSLDATAAYQPLTAGVATLTVDTRGSGVGPWGHEIQHQGQYTATWDGTCASIDGSWSTERDARTRSVDVMLSRCASACATGSVTRTTRDGRTLTLTLSGSVATWTSSTGRSGTVAQRCDR